MRTLLIFLLAGALLLATFQRERWDGATSAIGDWVRAAIAEQGESASEEFIYVNTESVLDKPDDQTLRALERLAKLYDQQP
jgi:hypothetical protein